MKSTRKINSLIRISIIPFFFVCLPIAFMNSFLRFIPVLNSLFIDYVNSGTSFFLPFFSYSNIVFHFSTGHLIDIFIIINIIGFIERSGYQYYRDVCLKKNYLELYSELYLHETDGNQEESSVNSNLILNLKEDSNIIINESTAEFYQKSRIKVNQFSSNSGCYSSVIKMKHNKLNYLHNSNKKNNQHKTIFQQFSTNTLINYHLPSKNYNIFSYSNQNIQQEEGI